MKILMTMMMMISVTSVFAECALNGTCSDDAACKALNKDFAVVGNKCIKPDASQRSTKCDQMVNKQQRDAVPADAAKPAAKAEDHNI